MGGSRPNIAIVGGGIGGLFGCQRSPRARTSGLRLRAGTSARRSGRRSFFDAKQRTPASESGARVRRLRNGEHGSARLPLLSARWQPDCARAGHGSSAGMQRSECTAPISSNFLADALPDNVVHAVHRCTGFDQRDDVARVTFSNGDGCRSRCDCAADGIHSELRPVRFSSVQSCFSRDPSPIAVFCRSNAFRIGRRTRG
jgi:salicylate hydroxylase